MMIVHISWHISIIEHIAIASSKYGIQISWHKKDYTIYSSMQLTIMINEQYKDQKTIFPLDRGKLVYPPNHAAQKFLGLKLDPQ
jgi:hypothetical protein